MRDPIIRRMNDQDIDQVSELDRLSFSSPWSKEIFYREIENPYAHYFVLDNKSEIIGYAGMWIVMEDAQITNIAIHPDYRRNKLGEKLFQHIFYYAMQAGVRRLSLEVRVSNIAAQRLYRKFGLVPGGIRKNYYTDNQEDALVMWVDLNG